TDEREQFRHTGGGQEGRRLIEQDQAGLPCYVTRRFDFLEGADNGQKRPLDRRQPIDALLRINIKVEAGQCRARRPDLVAPVDEGAIAGGQLYQAQIFENGERRYETEILMDEGHAETAKITGPQRQADG